MKKIIKKWGDSLVIVFDKEDCKAYGLKEGAILDLDDITVQSSSQILADENITKICEEMKE